MSDGMTEAYRGTYFKDRSKLPFGYDVRKEPKKENTLSEIKKVHKKIKQNGTF